MALNTRTRLGTHSIAPVAFKMVTSHCCVPLCTNDSRKGDKTTDEKLKKHWLIKIRRDEGKYFKITDATKVCSKHFVSEDFQTTYVGHRRLVKGAIPTIFSWTTATGEQTPRKPPTKRYCTLESEPHVDVAEDPEPDNDNNSENTPTPAPTRDHEYGINHKSSDEDLIAFLLKRVEVLEYIVEELSKCRFTVTRFTKDPEMLSFYTGFPNYKTFISCFDSLLRSRLSVSLSAPSPRMAALPSETFLSSKLANQKKASKTWKLGPSLLSPYEN